MNINYLRGQLSQFGRPEFISNFSTVNGKTVFHKEILMSGAIIAQADSDNQDIAQSIVEKKAGIWMRGFAEL